jgi:hypothetical protein
MRSLVIRPPFALDPPDHPPSKKSEAVKGEILNRLQPSGKNVNKSGTFPT